MQRKLSRQEKRELIESSEVRESEIEKPSYDDKAKNQSPVAVMQVHDADLYSDEEKVSPCEAKQMKRDLSDQDVNDSARIALTKQEASAIEEKDSIVHN